MTKYLYNERVEEIVGAAQDLFAKKGYHATNIADIAQRLEMGHGTFYRYFRNKLDIFDRVIDVVIQKVSESLSGEDPHATHSAAEYRAQVIRIGNRLMDLFMSDVRLSKLIFYEALGIDDEINRKVQDAMDAMGRLTELYLINGRDKGFLRPDLDTRITALAINAMILEAAKRIVHAPDPKVIATEWTRAVVALMFDGIAIPQEVRAS